MLRLRLKQKHRPQPHHQQAVAADSKRTGELLGNSIAEDSKKKKKGKKDGEKEIHTAFLLQQLY